MKRVLLVDDEELALQYLCSLISWEEEGYTIVAEMHSASQAESIMDTMPVDILVFDVSMPGLDGVGLSSWVHEHHPDIAMIAVSGFDSYDYVREIMKNGAYDYILKHRLTKETLLAALGQASARIPSPSARLEARPSAVPASRRDSLFLALESGSRTGLSREISRTLREAGDGWQAASRELVPFFLLCLSRIGAHPSPEEIGTVASCASRPSPEEAAESYTDALESILHPEEKPRYSHHVQAAVDFIEANYRLNIGLNDCASVIGVNASYLSHIFHEETGQVFTAFLAKVRLTHSLACIDEGLSLKETAYRCGFRDYSAFFKAFRKAYGKTPQEWAQSKNRQ